MYANRDTLGMHNGKPLLSEEGMVELRGLLDAHVAYDEAGHLHGEVTRSLSGQIAELEAKKSQLEQERERQKSVHHQARGHHRHGVESVVKKPGGDTNPVYAAVLRAIASDGQNQLWYPQSLEAADVAGRSLVELDEALSGNRCSLPAMVINRQQSGWTNVYLARVKRFTGLKPTLVPEKRTRGLRTYTIQRDALALPVRERHITAYQIDPGSFGRKSSIADYQHEKPGVRAAEDAFKIVLPQGMHWSTGKIGTYDSEGDVAEVQGSQDGELFSHSTFEFSIGSIAVVRALDALQQDFSGRSNNPQSQGMLFNQLAQLALGRREVLAA